MLAASIFLTSAQGQVLLYKEHIVLNRRTPGLRSRTIQNGWMLMDLKTHQIATVGVNRSSRQFFIEVSPSTDSVVTTRNARTTTTVVEKGTFSGLTMKGVVRNKSKGLAAVASSVLRVAGSNGDSRFAGTFLIDRAPTLAIAGATPSEVLQNIEAELIQDGYTSQ
jgi:hypothetical protein